MEGPTHEDLAITVLTCKGDLRDPSFPSLLNKLVCKLRRLVSDGKRPFQVTKVEPWNSVRVTFNISKEAAQRLRQLAERGDNSLRDLGVLSVQVEGDQVITLTIANNFNESQDLLIGKKSEETSKDIFSASSANCKLSSLSSFNCNNASFEDDAINTDSPHVISSASSSNSPSNNNNNSLSVELTRRNIAQYLSQQSSVISKEESATFKSPNVIAPKSEEPLPFISSNINSISLTSSALPSASSITSLTGSANVCNNKNSVSLSNLGKNLVSPSRLSQSNVGPFPFASMQHAMHTKQGTTNALNTIQQSLSVNPNQSKRLPLVTTLPSPAQGQLVSTSISSASSENTSISLSQSLNKPSLTTTTCSTSTLTSSFSQQFIRNPNIFNNNVTKLGSAISPSRSSPSSSPSSNSSSSSTSSSSSCSSSSTISSASSVLSSTSSSSTACSSSSTNTRTQAQNSSSVAVVSGGISRNSDTCNSINSTKATSCASSNVAFTSPLLVNLLQSDGNGNHIKMMLPPPPPSQTQSATSNSPDSFSKKGKQRKPRKIKDKPPDDYSSSLSSSSASSSSSPSSSQLVKSTSNNLLDTTQASNLDSTSISSPSILTSANSINQVSNDNLPSINVSKSQSGLSTLSSQNKVQLFTQSSLGLHSNFVHIPRGSMPKYMTISSEAQGQHHVVQGCGKLPSKHQQHQKLQQNQASKQPSPQLSSGERSQLVTVVAPLSSSSANVKERSSPTSKTGVQNQMQPQPLSSPPSSATTTTTTSVLSVTAAPSSTQINEEKNSSQSKQLEEDQQSSQISSSLQEVTSSVSSSSDLTLSNLSEESKEANASSTTIAISCLNENNKTQHLINPFTGHLEPMCCDEEMEEDGDYDVDEEEVPGKNENKDKKMSDRPSSYEINMTQNQEDYRSGSNVERSDHQTDFVTKEKNHSSLDTDLGISKIVNDTSQSSSEVSNSEKTSTESVSNLTHLNANTQGQNVSESIEPRPDSILSTSKSNLFNQENLIAPNAISMDTNVDTSLIGLNSNENNVNIKLLASPPSSQIKFSHSSSILNGSFQKRIKTNRNKRIKSISDDNNHNFTANLTSSSDHLTVVTIDTDVNLAKIDNVSASSANLLQSRASLSSSFYQSNSQNEVHSQSTFVQAPNCIKVRSNRVTTTTSYPVIYPEAEGQPQVAHGCGQLPLRHVNSQQQQHHHHHFSHVVTMPSLNANIPITTQSLGAKSVTSSTNLNLEYNSKSGASKQTSAQSVLTTVTSSPSVQPKKIEVIDQQSAQISSSLQEATSSVSSSDFSSNNILPQEGKEEATTTNAAVSCSSNETSKTQRLINPFTGHLEPMCSDYEEDEEEEDDDDEEEEEDRPSPSGINMLQEVDGCGSTSEKNDKQFERNSAESNSKENHSSESNSKENHSSDTDSGIGKFVNDASSQSSSEISNPEKTPPSLEPVPSLNDYAKDNQDPNSQEEMPYLEMVDLTVRCEDDSVFSSEELSLPNIISESVYQSQGSGTAESDNPDGDTGHSVASGDHNYTSVKSPSINNHNSELNCLISVTADQAQRIRNCMDVEEKNKRENESSVLFLNTNSEANSHTSKNEDDDIKNEIMETNSIRIDGFNRGLKNVKFRKSKKQHNSEIDSNDNRLSAREEEMNDVTIKSWKKSRLRPNKLDNSSTEDEQDLGLSKNKRTNCRETKKESNLKRVSERRKKVRNSNTLMGQKVSRRSKESNNLVQSDDIFIMNDNRADLIDESEEDEMDKSMNSVYEVSTSSVTQQADQSSAISILNKRKTRGIINTGIIQI